MFATDQERVLCDRRNERGQAVVLVLVLLAIGAGIAWWLFHSRARCEEEAREFARDAATRLAFDLDRKFLDRVIAPEQMTKYPPSFRDRIIAKLRGFGRPTAPVEVAGDVYFTSHFFQPNATFRADLKYPTMPAAIYFSISRPRGWWQIDQMTVSWEQPPPPPPELAPASSPPG